MIALSGARNAPESVGTYLDPLEVLEGRLEELGQQRELVEAAVDEAENELDRVLRLQRTLDTAREHLQRAAERAHRLLAPRLETLMSEWIPIITQGRYVDAFVDPETLQVRLRTTNGTVREAALLSHGTAEQVYLVLRMILAQVLTERHERCPMLLDDPSVHADVDRKRRYLSIFCRHPTTIRSSFSPRINK